MKTEVSMRVRMSKIVRTGYADGYKNGYEDG